MRTWLLGVPVDGVTMESALERVGQWLGQPQGRTRIVLTPNPEVIMEAARDPALAALFRAADLALPDGVGVVWALRHARQPVAGRVPGVEFMMALLGLAATGTFRVFFLGARPEVLAKAVRQATQRFPGLLVAGQRDGFYPPEEEEEVVRGIRDAGADILLVGMGSARQHAFLARHREDLGVGVAMAVGGSLDVLADESRRAPEAWRRAGLEWLWRLLQEPWRWRRQLALPRFAASVVLRGSAAVRPDPPER